LSFAARVLPPLVAIGAAVLVVSVARLRDRQPSAAPVSVDSAAFAMIRQDGHRRGPADAPVTIVMYFDYGCRFCARFEPGLDSVTRRHPEMVAVLMKAFVPPVVGWPFATALAGECAASQGRFQEFVDSAYANPGLAGAAEGWRRLGIMARVPNGRAFAACVMERRFESTIRKNFDEATRIGATGTPFLLVNGRAFRGAVPAARLEEVVLEEGRRAR
jgi:protein-disulfide isomerase